MARKKTKKQQKNMRERDGSYLLKLVFVLILASVWLKFSDPLMLGVVPFAGIPLGAIVGIFLIHRYEAIDEDRKIWFAVLLVVTVLTYFTPAGILI